MLTSNGKSRVALAEDWFAKAFDNLSTLDYYAFIAGAQSPHGVYTRAVAKASADLSAAKKAAQARLDESLAALRSEYEVAKSVEAFQAYTRAAGLPLLERAFEIEEATQLYREAVLPHKMEYSAALEALYLKYSPKEGTNRRERGTTGEPDMMPDEEEPVEKEVDETEGLEDADAEGDDEEDEEDEDGDEDAE